MRRLSLFALIFIILAGLYWFLEGPGKKQVLREPSNLLGEFKTENIERINITSPGSGAIVLQRADKGWQVAADLKTFYAADNSAVETLFESLAKLKTSSMVSRKPDRHALYEVSAETGIQVETLGNGETLANVLIGKSGPNIFSTYVRVADNDAVYLVDGILQNTASKTLNEWRDKAIFDINPELISTYTISGTPALTLKKTDGKWWFESENTPANSAAVEQALRTLATLSAADFAEATLEEFNLTAPARTITAGFDNGSQATLLIGSDANAFQQYAKTVDSETIYIIEKHLLGMLCPTIEELNTPEPEEEVPAEPIDRPRPQAAEAP